MHGLPAQIAHAVASVDHRVFGNGLPMLGPRKDIVAIGFAAAATQQFHDLTRQRHEMFARHLHALWRQAPKRFRPVQPLELIPRRKAGLACPSPGERSEEHTSELQSLMRISYAVFCLKKKNKNT